MRQPEAGSAVKTAEPQTALAISNVNLPDQLPAETSQEFPEPLTGMPVEMVEEIKQRCLANVAAAVSGDTRTTVAQLSELGVEKQREAARTLELLKGPVGEALKKSQKPDDVEIGLIELRQQVDAINPAELQKGGQVVQFIGNIPVIGPPVAAILRPTLKQVLYKVAVQYESRNEFMDAIIKGIRLGMDMLLRDNIELEVLYQNFWQQQAQIALVQYEGRVQVWALDKEISKHPESSATRRALESVLTQVVVRVQDLSVMYEVNAQAFIGIDMTQANNKVLYQAADRSLTVITNLLTISLAIQAALGRQQRVAQAVNASREAAGNMLVANAEAIKQQTKVIGNLYTQPSVAMNKLTQAHGNLIGALDEAEKVIRVGRRQARLDYAALEKMSVETMSRASAIRTANNEQAAATAG